MGDHARAADPQAQLKASHRGVCSRNGKKSYNSGIILIQNSGIAATDFLLARNGFTTKGSM